MPGPVAVPQLEERHEQFDQRTVPPQHLGAFVVHGIQVVVDDHHQQIELVVGVDEDGSDSHFGALRDLARSCRVVALFQEDVARCLLDAPQLVEFGALAQARFLVGGRQSGWILHERAGREGMRAAVVSWPPILEELDKPPS